MRPRFAIAATVVGLLALPVAALPPENPPAAPGRVPEPPGTARSGPEERIFSLKIVHAFTSIPKSVRAFDLWVPIPPDDNGQKVFNRVTYAPYAVGFATDEGSGNQYMHMTGGPRGGVPMQVSIGIDVQRTEVGGDAGGSRLREGAEPGAPESPVRWLPQTEAVLPEVRKRVDRILEGKTTAIEKARAIYDWMIDSLEALERPERYPWTGYGKVETVLREKRGSSTDLAAVFVAFSRAAGIPARCVIGYRIPEGSKWGHITRHDGWAEFFVEPTGWISVDPAAADAAPSRRDAYFGRLDPWRITLSRGTEITLIPPQTGPPVRFLQDPYWEGNGQPMPAPGTTVEYTLIDAVPPPPTVPLGPAGSSSSGR